MRPRVIVATSLVLSVSAASGAGLRYGGAALELRVGVAVVSQAGTWCDNFDGVIAPLAVFCDDFDRYCPPPNDPCPQSPLYDNYFRNAWPTTSWSYHNSQNQVCGNNLIGTNVQSQLTTAYQGGRVVNGGDEAGTLGQSSRFMTAGIRAKFGNQYDRVLGTDAAPLVLEFDMSSGIQSAAGLDISNGFVELALEEHALTKQEYLALGYDPEVSPTDYIKVGGIETGTCISCRGECAAMLAARGMPDDDRAPHHAWPTICQSYDARLPGSLCPDPANPNGPGIPCPPPYCPQTPPDKLHKTLAIGALAMLDPNPCHCENPVKPDISHCGPGNTCNTATGFCSTVGGSSRPCTSDADCPKEMQEYTNHTMTNKHLSFFDGWKWRILSSKIFDPVEGIPGVVGSGDFLLGDKIDHVVFIIKTNTVRIEHWNAQNRSQWVPYAGSICTPDLQVNDTIAGGITITNPGSGYTSAPAVTIGPPGPNGRQATAVATVNDGAVTAITITDVGMGYSSAPVITIAPPSAGTQATATATLGGAAHYEPALYSWADNIPRKFLGAFNTIRLGNPSSCRLCSVDLVNAGGDYANCAPGSWNGTDYECTEFNQNWGSGATWCKRMSGINGCYGTNIDDGSNFVHFDTLVLKGGTADAAVGACCSPADGACTVTTEEGCALLGGAYAGGGGTCQPDTCIGACCQGSRVCTDTFIHQCAGRFRGPGTSCATGECPCHTPFADFDEDGDADMDDFGGFQRCVTGYGNLVAGCECFNRDNDTDVDAADFAAFAACVTGPSVPLDVQNPPPGCVP